jgi:peptidoglycan/LPS O-acetylase OafA/YrhL
MRGLAALYVVAYHGRHLGLRPWAWLDHGWMAVDFFFVLSGVVMAYRYAETLDGFVRARFARLYPLHALALLVCAGVQWSRIIRGLPEVIYQHSDLYHFALQALLLNSGGFEEGWSYNSPSWSVAVEIVSYVLFATFASRWSGKRFAWASALAAVGALAVYRFGLNLPILNPQVARGVLGFFVGALTLQVGSKWPGASLWAFGALCLLIAVGNAIGAGFVGGTTLPFLLCIFPLLVATGIGPMAWLFSFKPIALLGDWSYALYMSHVPLQMVALACGWAPTFPVYILSVLAVSVALHYAFERPLRAWLRDVPIR